MEPIAKTSKPKYRQKATSYHKELIDIINRQT